MWLARLPLPVVHEDVWLPQFVRGHAYVLNVAVLGLVPAHVDVVPFLQAQWHIETTKQRRELAWFDWVGLGVKCQLVNWFYSIWKIFFDCN